MKRSGYILVILVIAYAFTACRKNISCFNSTSYGIQFFTPSLSNVIPDTGATITRFGKGSNFLTVVDTLPHFTLDSISVFTPGIFAQKYISFTAYDTDIYTTDMLITLSPSGRVYKVTNVAHDNRTMSEKNSSNYACSDDITYSVNGVACETAGQIFQSGSSSTAVLSISY